MGRPVLQREEPRPFLSDRTLGGDQGRDPGTSTAWTGPEGQRAAEARWQHQGHDLPGRRAGRMDVERDDAAAGRRHRYGHPGRRRLRTYPARVPETWRRHGDRGRGNRSADEPDRGREGSRLEDRLTGLRVEQVHAPGIDDEPDPVAGRDMQVGTDPR